MKRVVHPCALLGDEGSASADTGYRWWWSKTKANERCGQELRAYVCGRVYQCRSTGMHMAVRGAVSSTSTVRLAARR